jgi:transposase InsO family protein
MAIDRRRIYAAMHCVGCIQEHPIGGHHQSFLGAICNVWLSQHIRNDNGPEFIAKSIQTWVKELEIGTLYVEPGSPWENGYAESFHSRLRDELMSVTEFESLKHARACGAAWREDYNEYRPHSSLGGLNPTEYARRCAASVSAAPSLQQHSEPLLLH